MLHKDEIVLIGQKHQGTRIRRRAGLFPKEGEHVQCVGADPGSHLLATRGCTLCGVRRVV